MTRKTKKSPTPFDNEWLGAKLPIVSTLKDCRQLSEDHWQGIDVDGAIVDVKGGPMPRSCLLVPRHPFEPGIIRVIHAK